MSYSDQNLSGKCPRCGVMTAAPIVATGLDEPMEMGKTSRKILFCRCTGCNREFLVDAYDYVPPLNEVLEDADIRNSDRPKRSKYWEERFPLQHIESLEGLPMEIEVFYREATMALASGLPNAAGAMFRKSLEASTVGDYLIGKIAENERAKYRSASLYARISSLKAAGAIHPSLYEVADVVRQEGNAAVHDIESYSMDEANALKAFTDAFLNNVVLLPSLISATRSALAKAERGEKK